MTEYGSTPGGEVANGGRLAGLSLQALLEAMPMPAYVCDGHGQIVALNAKAADLWGEDLRIGGSDRTLLVAAAAGAARSSGLATTLARQVLGEPHLMDDVAIVVEAGNDRTLRAFASVAQLVGDVGPSGLFLKTFRMAPAARRAMARGTKPAGEVAADLRRSERNFALLVGSIIDYAVFMLDPNGIISNWNAGAERIKGYRAEEIIGSHFSRFYTAEDRAHGVPAMALATAEQEGRYSAEGWRVRKDGTHFWAMVVIDPIIDHGKLVGFAKVTRDITARREAEAALIESEYLARGVIDTALDGFVQLDEEGLVVQWNPWSEVMFGWSREQAIGQSLSSLVVPEDARDHFAESVRAGSAEMREPSGQFEVINREGRRIPVELSISSLLLNGGRRTNIFIRDLSEKVLIEAQLRQAQKMEAVGQLTGGLAHDFNNLLQGIIGSLDLIQLRVGAGNTADVGRFVKAALNSANRAAALTHRLLAFSRRQPLDPRPVQANPLLLSMTDLLQKALGERVTLKFELAPDLWTALCDPNQLESAVLNLSINARDAMTESGGLLVVRTRNAGAGEMRTADKRHEATAEQYTCIEVIDDGAGMPPEVVDHAFEPFFTTKAPGQGTGLGLSMVYGFARQSNGFCHIDSRPGGGTTVAIYLPRHAGIVEIGEETGARAAPPPVPGSGEKVLVVEDERIVRNIVVEVLHQIGYAALEASDGETGRKLLESNEAVHLLISDIRLPGMSGRELANLARELRPDLKVLLMTGYASDASAPEAYVAGMELITKPFTVEALASRLRKLLGKTAT
ncbi:MAG: PAS domain S-box protein [Rhodanobacter sp.]